MRSLLSLFLLATVTQQRTGFDGLRSTLIKFLTEETRGDVSQVVLLTRRDMWMNVSRVAMNPLLNLEEKELKIKVNTVLEKSGETIRSMVGRLQEIYEKSRVFGVLGVETFRACCLVGFSPRFLEASVGNKTKMVEKILIRAPPTQEEAEARFLEDMLVDITVTPNFTESMTEQEKSRIDFLLDSIRISGEATKSQEEKEMAVVVQFKRNRYLRRFFLEYLRDFNVEDLAARIVQQFNWIQIAASKEQYAQMTREQKIEEVIKGVKKTFSHTVKV